MFIILAVVGIAYAIYKFFIYPVYKSPLSKIPPAHFTASWSPLWILWIRYTSIEVQTIHKAHLKHGPVVRLGPNEVSVNCVDGGLRTVYTGGFEKTYFYDQFENYGLPCMFSIKESKPHSIRKRMISNVYSKTFLQSSTDVYELTRSILYDRLLPMLASSAATGSEVEVYALNYATTMDFVSSYIFGLGNDSNFIRDIEMRTKYLSWHFKRSEHSFWFQEIPRLTQIIQSIGIRLVPKWVDVANSELHAYTLTLCRRASQSRQIDYNPQADKEQRTRPVVYTQLAESLKKSSGKTEDAEQHQAPQSMELHIASELLDHVIAGMDTSAVTLTYLIWEMSKDPDMQYELRKELRTLSPTLVMENSAAMPSARSVDALPLLHSIVMETLRRHAVIPGSQPRITPVTPTSLAGSPPLPGGVKVSAQAYSLHRNEEVFATAEAWNPKRWLQASAKDREEMMRWFWAFGSGGRMCIGNNFAMQELKYVTAAVYSNFATSVVDDTGMEQVDGYTAGPEDGEQLKLKFTRLEPKGEDRLPPLQSRGTMQIVGLNKTIDISYKCTMPKSLEDLPPELLAQIVSYSANARTLCCVALTCRKLHEFFQSNEGYRAFVQRRFPSIQTPPCWKDAAHGLTTLSRAWDRKSIVARCIRPPQGPWKPRFQDQRRARGQTMGYQPVIDSYGIWTDTDWKSRKEILARGAGAELTIRLKWMGSGIEEQWQSARRNNESTLEFDQHHHRSKWWTVKDPLVREGQDDITAVKCLKHWQKPLSNREYIIVGRASGKLDMLSIDYDTPDEWRYESHFITEEQHIRSASVSSAEQPLLAACISDRTVTIYSVSTGHDFLPPLGKIQVTDPNVSEFNWVWYTTFLRQDRLAVSLGPSTAPIQIFDVRPRAIPSHPIRTFSIQEKSREGRIGLLKASISSLVPLPSASEGNLFLSGGYDGIIRLIRFLFKNFFKSLYFRLASPSISSAEGFEATSTVITTALRLTPYVTNQRVVYLPSAPTAQLQSFSAPILNLQDTHVEAPFFGANSWTGILKPVSGGNIPAHHAYVKLSMTFKDGGAFDFATIYERIKETAAQAVDVARENGRSEAADLSDINLEQLPAYEEVGNTMSAPNPPPLQQPTPISAPTAQAPLRESGVVFPPDDERNQKPPVTAVQQQYPPPNEPPPGYEEVQQRSIADSLERRWLALTGLVWKKLRDASQDKLQIVDGQGEAQQMQYSEVLKLLRHDQYLEKLEEPSKVDPTYRITNIFDRINKRQDQKAKRTKPIKFRMAGRSKGLHLNSTLSAPAYHSVLSASSNHIIDGCRVEIYVDVAKSERRKMGFDFMMVKNPHLRPETVLKSMPEGTKITYEPLFDTAREQLVWVMENESKWLRGRRPVGWSASANGRPKENALKVLRELPVVVDHQQPREKPWE
ncbi:MAG: hypothetical protein LQ348_003994 [Seirophora lacunosa]|nr:MAG: hypothetical protein LQ348_003994 [Seirophora lacunosa]